MSKLDNKTFPNALRKAHEYFTDQYCRSWNIEIDGYRFIGCIYSSQKFFDFAKHRNEIGDAVGLKKYNMLQVVGDCSQGFSPAGVKKSLGELEKYVHKDTVIEYGFTASPNDANSIVNQYIRKHPAVAKRVVANVVLESGKAVEEWGCEAEPLVKTFILNYDLQREHDKFGDDMWLSDGIMDASKGDMMLCLEGGVQSFEQSVTILRHKIPLVTLTNIRVPENKRFKYFSSAALLYQIDHLESTNMSERLKVTNKYLKATPGLNDDQKAKIIRLVTKGCTDTEWQSRITTIRKSSS